jgi:hypothetical protein
MFCSFVPLIMAINVILTPNLVVLIFSGTAYVISTCFRVLAPSLIDVTPVNVHRIYELSDFFWKTSRTSRIVMNNASGTIVPVYVLV